MVWSWYGRSTVVYGHGMVVVWYASTRITPIFTIPFSDMDVCIIASTYKNV